MSLRSVLRGSERRKRPMEFSTPPFCQGLWGTQKKVWTPKPVMLGELGSVVEADGFTQRLWKFAELTGDGPSGQDSFSIERVQHDAEAGLSLVENQQSLAISGEQHEVGFPMARRLAAFDLGRSFSDRAPLFDEAGRAAAWASPAPASEFVTRQQAVPVILLGRTMINETID